MKGAPGGFTVVEVMMVLSISAIMMVSAISVFSNRREEANFSQSVFDLRSELQSIANDVSSQSVPSLDRYKCTAATVSGVMRPTLQPGSATSKDCIYLGQALQVSADSTNLYSYPIFGLRTTYDASGSPTTNLPTSPDEADQEVAIDSGGNFIPQLTTTYTLLNGLKVVSAKNSSTGTESDILTLFSNLQSDNTAGNEIAVSAFPVSGSGNPDSQVRSCIESSGSCSAIEPLPVTSSTWNLCVDYIGRKAQINLKGTPTGISTVINMKGCG